jgi:AAA family ATP:ADP antiporter
MLIHHPASAVRARTIAVLAAWNDPSIARDDFIHHPDYETARTATASALSLYWNGSPQDRHLLLQLLRDSSADVARQAIVTAGMVGFREATPVLIETLADKKLRRDARDALLKLGSEVIPALVRRLSDHNEPISIRTRIPKTLALTGTQQAADALMEHLHSLDYHLDHAVMKALNRMRIDSPGIVVDAARVHRAISKEREEYDRLRAIRARLESNPLQGRVFPLLMRTLAERLEQRRERVFRLVGLIYSPQDIYSVYYSWQIKPAMRPSAVEFLDNLLDVEMKQTVVPLLEQDADLQVEVISHAAALEMLLSGEDPWLKAIVRDLIADCAAYELTGVNRRNVL